MERTSSTPGIYDKYEITLSAFDKMLLYRVMESKYNLSISMLKTLRKNRGRLRALQDGGTHKSSLIDLVMEK